MAGFYALAPSGRTSGAAGAVVIAPFRSREVSVWRLGPPRLLKLPVPAS